MKKYFLFSATSRCAPCRLLVSKLDEDFPEWKDYVEYIDADSMTKENREMAIKLMVMHLPSFCDSERVIFRGFDKMMIAKIKELCLTKV